MIVIVQSLWNKSLTDLLTTGAQEFCKANNQAHFTLQVPGSLEIPLAIQWAAQNGKTGSVTGAIACGVIVKGETLHFDLVAQESARALMDLSLSLEIPIGNAILPAYTVDQAIERCGGKHGNKGQEAAEAVIKMLDLRRTLV